MDPTSACACACACAKVWETKADKLSKEVGRLQAENLGLTGQLGMANAAVTEEERLATKKSVVVAVAEITITEEETVAVEAPKDAAEHAVVAEAIIDAAERTAVPNKCEDCNKVFPAKKQFREHMKKSHNGKKDFKCAWDLCEMAFSSRSGLERHKPVHIKKMFKKFKFKCAVCDKGFDQKANLKSHSLVHSDLKPFSCSECGQRFPRKQYLEKHIVKHAEVSPHKCSECGKGFGQKSYLKTHMKIHRPRLRV